MADPKFLTWEGILKVNERIEQLSDAGTFEPKDIEVYSSRVKQIGEDALILLSSTANFCSATGDYQMLDNQLELLVHGSVSDFDKFAERAKSYFLENESGDGHDPSL